MTVFSAAATAQLPVLGSASPARRASAVVWAVFLAAALPPTVWGTLPLAMTPATPALAQQPARPGAPPAPPRLVLQPPPPDFTIPPAAGPRLGPGAAGNAVEDCTPAWPCRLRLFGTIDKYGGLGLKAPAATW